MNFMKVSRSITIDRRHDRTDFTVTSFLVLISIWQPWKDDYSLYFLLGKGPEANTTENLTIKKGILEEYQKFDDIVIGK